MCQEIRLGWLGWLGWAYKMPCAACRKIPCPSAAAQRAVGYGILSPAGKVTLSRKRDVRPGRLREHLAAVLHTHGTSAAIRPNPREPPTGPSRR